MRAAARGFLYFLAVLSISAVSIGSWEWYRTAHKTADSEVETTKNVENKNDESLNTLPKASDLEAFEKFEKDFNRKYESEASRMAHFKIFADNLKMISEYNANNKNVVLAINEFADIHPETFAKNRMGLNMPTNMSFRKNLGTWTGEGVEAPKEIDWVKKGAVTPVKNQGQCGSCWSFSTTGALEGRYQIATGTLKTISEQQFVDCDTSEDHGCNGGLMDYAFKFAEDHGLCSEESFPYTAKDGECPADLESTCDIAIKKGEVTGFHDVKSFSVQAMEKALSQGPVSVAIEADQPAFQFYSKGVITEPKCGQALDHGVLAVGYGVYESEDGEKIPYWKVKNSWGASWGQEGYVLIAKKLDADGDSECGILKQPSFPVISKSADEEPKKPTFSLKGSEAFQQAAQEEVFI